MNKTMPFNRVQAGLTHLSASATIASIALALVYWIWYPGVMAEAQGVSRLLIILVAVDVVLGPLITTVIWNPAKGEWLRFDLFVIAVVQTVALLYGLQAIYGGRPVYLVFSVDRFDVTAYQQVDPSSLSRAPAEFQRSFWGYKTLSARLPDDQKEREDLMFGASVGGADVPQLPHLFLPLDAERSTMLEMLRPMKQLKALNGINDEDWAKLIASFGKSEIELGYLPMAANVKDGAVILDAKSGEIVGIRLLAPDFSIPKKPQRAKPNASDPSPATERPMELGTR